MRSFNKLLAGFKKMLKPAAKRTLFQKARLGVEALESRELLSATPILTQTAATVKTAIVQTAAPAVAIPSNLTGLAQLMQTSGLAKAPTGPTTIYLNFSGYTNCPSGVSTTGNVAAFTGTAKDIDDILYRTSEIFAPFNVEVTVISGDGSVGTTPGSSTIFVGANGKGSTTLAASSDYPCSNNPNSGTSHVVNSDTSPDVAFVDPNIGSLATSPNKDLEIADRIAHEAGHTFGLAHVRTDGMADYPNNPIGTIGYDVDLPPDIMSYDSNDDYFSNNSYNVTEANGSGVSPTLFPEYKSTYITMQNSFTYLQTVLGARPANSPVGVIDENVRVINSGVQTLNTVDPNYYAATASVKPMNLTAATTVSGTLQTGDYAAYSLNTLISTLPAGQELDITPTAGSHISFMLYDETTQTTSTGSLVAYTNNDTPMGFIPTPGVTYELVVGGTLGQMVGAFSFTIGGLPFYLPGSTFTLRNSSQVITGQLAVTSQIGVDFAGTFTPVDATRIPVNVAGSVGAVVNGSSNFNFIGGTESIQTSGGPKVIISTITAHTVGFSGTLSHFLNTFTISGSGGYAISVTTITTSLGVSKSSLVTNETLKFVTGSTPSTGIIVTVYGELVQGSSGTGSSTAPAITPSAAAQPVVVAQIDDAALDLLLTQSSSGGTAATAAADVLFQSLGPIAAGGSDPFVK